MHWAITVSTIVADLCRHYSADVVNAEVVKTMVVHAMKELFGQVISERGTAFLAYVVHVINTLLKGYSLV